MTTREIADMSLALAEAFANALEHGCAGLPAHRCHIHVCFMPNPTGFAIEIRDHGPGFGVPLDDGPALPDRGDGGGLNLMRSLVHDLCIDRHHGDTVITMHHAYSLTSRDPSAWTLSTSAT
jgi:anti-sigma regulatory factor (Ser/Thr protein kinase)